MNGVWLDPYLERENELEQLRVESSSEMRRMVKRGEV
jgi:hypothetical protein